MFKLLFTLLKGQAHAAGEALAEANALPLLDQQIREAVGCHEQARRALALAVAESQREDARCAALDMRIEGLEARTRLALANGHEALALEAAGAIAVLEMDLATAMQGGARLRLELDRLREANLQTERRLSELQRGRHLARIRGDVSRARRTGTGSGPLDAAEATLARLRLNQEAAALAAAAPPGSNPAALERKLADAGCGPALHPTAESVLARLRQPRLSPPESQAKEAMK